MEKQVTVMLRFKSSAMCISDCKSIIGILFFPFFFFWLYFVFHRTLFCQQKRMNLEVSWRYETMNYEIQVASCVCIIILILWKGNAYVCHCLSKPGATINLGTDISFTLAIRWMDQRNQPWLRPHIACTIILLGYCIYRNNLYSSPWFTSLGVS